MNTLFRRNEARKPVNNEVGHVVRPSPRSCISQRQVAGGALAVAIVISATACGGQSAASISTSRASESASATATPTPTPTAPASSACLTENATEKYLPKIFICTKTDAGKLLWLEQTESKRVTDARAAAAAKVAAEKAAADKAAQDAAAKAAAEQAAAEAARQEAAAAEAARQQQAAAAAAAAAAIVPAPAAPAAPSAPSGCDSNYAGACVPIASDVDCAGGSGNGPAYVRGPVTVVGSDIYGLDNDRDGVGCEG
jgi:flagellar biosynthesis GTPase FlhF